MSLRFNTGAFGAMSAHRSESGSSWLMPPWGHPLAQSILPFWISARGRLFPVGTAFVLSHGVVLIASAEHNVREALRQHSGGDQLMARAQAGRHTDIDEVGIWLLYTHFDAGGAYRLTFWPLETAGAAVPTDVLVAFPKFAPGVLPPAFPIHFGIPQPKDRVRCVGYCNVKFPTDGIPAESIRDGSFDWSENYSHEFRVVEASVMQVFSDRFAAAYVDGPCFTIDAEIPHGMSGGPAFNSSGQVCGVNSAGATMFYGGQASVISLLFPILLTQIHVPMRLGALTMNFNQPVMHFITTGAIDSAGTEAGVRIRHDADGQPLIRIGITDAHVLYDDFGTYQQASECVK